MLSRQPPPPPSLPLPRNQRSNATGVFPPSISAFTSLLVISCYSNSITGQFPWSSLSSLPSLVSISLGDNYILPTPPNSVGGYVLPGGSTFLPCPAGWYGPDRGRGECIKCKGLSEEGVKGGCFIGQISCDEGRYPCGDLAPPAGDGGREGR
jgi:hypothetical protein